MTPRCRRSTRRCRFCARARGLRRRQPCVRPAALRARAPRRDGGGAENPRRHAGHSARDDRDGVLSPADFEALSSRCWPSSRNGTGGCLPADVLRAGGRPLVQFPLRTLEATWPTRAPSASRCAIACPDASSATPSEARSKPRRGGRRADPHYGDNNTFFLQATGDAPPSSNTSNWRTTCWSRSASGPSPRSRSSRR